MSLTKEFFSRETNISAKVIADSISESGIRITTLEVEYPRFIHGELMTHRALSKNSSSSRAIPIQKMLDQIENNMAVPVYWGKSKSGMQADGEVERSACITSQMWWESSFNEQKCFVNRLANLGLHKQVPNRLTEPFQIMKVVITGTDWDNFFNLRIHKDAQPEICMLAYKMYEVMQASEPFKLKSGEYHLPYIVTTRDNNGNIMYVDSNKETHYVEYSLEDAIKVSASCCAQVSYRNTDMSLEKADKIFNMLIKSDVLHASCFEHLATPIRDQSKNINGWDEGITHQRKDGKFCSGNLTGWISYRQQLSNNTCWKFDFEERMKMFE